MTLKLEVGERDETVAAEITARLAAFNHAAAPDCDSTPFQVTLRDDAGKLVGAVIAAIRFDVLRIDDVFVDDSVRGQDWGTKLMDACEGEGVARGARLATVMTYSWQARPFYEKRGYTLFAELPYNQGEHHIYWLKKTLCE